MADLLVVTGPPGAGKSTVAALVVDSFGDGALVPGDLFFSFRRGALAAGGMDPRHVLADLPDDASDVAELVLQRCREGSLVVRA